MAQDLIDKNFIAEKQWAMNVRELAAALDAAQVHKSWYAIYGRTPETNAVYTVVDADDLTDEGGLILRQEPAGEWVIRIRERGSERTEARFPSETEACRWLYAFMARAK